MKMVNLGPVNFMAASSRNLVHGFIRRYTKMFWGVEASDMHSFTSLGSYEVAKRGTVHVVANPVECSDWTHLMGHDVVIDGKLYRVTGVEFFAHNWPQKVGEKIGLLVAPRKTGALE